MRPGEQFGPYEIVEKIGEGGMGEVYLARDPDLRRSVAIKVLPASLSDDPERLARFQREAEVLASLNHPNIASLYGLVRTDSGIALAMEFVDGNAPAGPMPFDEAWAIASQMADALEYAHDRGIVHRDLKPANVRVTPDGRVKLLDFGLARAWQEPVPASGSPDNSPTITAAMTLAGTILGTAAYMAPEQARGKRVDPRADIWSWAVVLVELLSGRRVFEGADIQETLSLVLTAQPDLSAVPPYARRMVARCLEKDPPMRLRHLADARHLLEDRAPEQVRPRDWRTSLGFAAAAVSLVVAAGIGWVHFSEMPASPAELTRFEMTPPRMEQGFAFYMALAPDGRSLAYTASNDQGRIAVWVRRFNDLEPHMLAGTEGAASLFWSPDSRYIGFSVISQVWKVDASGASRPTPLAAAAPDQAAGMGSWSPAGDVLFGARGFGAIRLASERGDGSSRDVTALAPGESFHSFPSFLPDGRHFLYLRPAGPQGPGIYVGSLDTPAESQSTERLIDTPFGAQYVPAVTGHGGYVFYMSGPALVARSFDAERLRFTGEPMQLADGVGTAGAAAYFTAVAGAMAYRTAAPNGRQMTLFRRDGSPKGTAGDPRQWTELRLSPDGTRVVAVEEDLWVVDLTRGASTRLTFEPGLETSPVWSPDGESIVYSGMGTAASPTPRVGRVVLRRPVRGGDATVLPVNEEALGALPLDISPDGSYILMVRGGAFVTDLFVLPARGGGAPTPLVTSPFAEVQASFSPDGRWVTYISNQSGRFEVYVRPFVPPGTASADTRSGQFQISTAGGYQPRWSRSGKEIIYLAPDGRFTVVDVSVGTDSIQSGVPRTLFPSRIAGGASAQGPAVRWDIDREGNFLVLTDSNATTASPMTVTVNWQQPLAPRE